MRLKTFGGLWIENAEGAAESSPRPRSLALLAILAAAGRKGVSRDRVLGILWPEADADRARHALSQLLYSLRRELGAEVALSTPDLRLDSHIIASDVDDFRAAVRGRNWKEASDLYVGPFLDGFYLLDAPEFERWAETERAALASDGLRALDEFAKTSEAGGRIEEAAEHWRRLTRFDPVSARYATAYMNALWAMGDRAAALAHGKEHVDLLRREFDARPDRTVAQLLDRLRTEDTPDTGAVVPAVTAPVAEPVPSEHRRPVSIHNADLRDGTVEPMPPGRRRRALAAIVGAVVIVVLALVAWRSDMVPTRRTSAPVLAVGQIRDLVTPDSLALGGVLSEMLATSLGRLAELQVIANSRMLELIPAHADSSRGAVSDAARRAGATEIIEGEIRPLAGGLLVLDIRRVSIPRGLVRAGYRISGNNRIALFDSVTNLIAADLRVDPPVGSLAEVSTRSPLAYRLYEEGLREYYRQDANTAARLFQSALREDSTFAMAAYYAWRTALFTSDTSATTLGKLAIALASRASPRDRLLIRTHIGYGALAPSVVAAAAESLSSLYDHDPEALIVASRFMNDLSKSTALLNQSIALDSLGGVQPGAVCRLCEAVARLEERYEWADSIDAALRTLDRWSRLRPEDFSAWSVRANLLARLGRRADAVAALRRAQSLGVRDNPQMRSLIFSLFLDDIAATNAQCDTALATRDDAAFSDFRWYCTIGLRIQGRYADAAALMLHGRIPGSSATHLGVSPELHSVAILDFESGRPLAAADTFLAIGRYNEASMAPARIVDRAQNATWMNTLAATAAIAGGDTARARRLVDTIETSGRLSAYDRDQVLHHFVSGLLLSRAGRHADAVHQFRMAMVSPTNGYTRVNYELGRSLLALGQVREAIPVLRAPLYGGIEGSGLYLTRTELHEQLARAFDQAGQRDSAAAHFAVVERAWRNADAFLKPRYDAARSRLAELRH